MICCYKPLFCPYTTPDEEEDLMIQVGVEILLKQGYQKIGILPYFLFNGAITDAIANTINQLSQTYPNLQFHLTTPLGATEELARLVSDLVSRPPR